MIKEKKRYYKIGEAAKIVGVEPYVLRFWEKEFKEFKPVRSSTGQRLYTEEHLDLVRKIKRLLYEEKLTLEGAKKRLQAEGKWLDVFLEIRTELKEILAILSN
ncbi:MAG: MerR family transcriptional regulator [Desulfonauticus sp.]|nr:MerR family transcriptional regulator [Desulfonauticus sp.]